METKEAILATISEFGRDLANAESNEKIAESSAKFAESNKDSANVGDFANKDSAKDSAFLRDSAKNANFARDFTTDSVKNFTKDSANKNPTKDSIKSNKFAESNIFIDIKEEAQSPQNAESALLLQLREKSLVLFEGLRNVGDDESAKMKVEMVIAYLEYQLYVIEERLKEMEVCDDKNFDD
ncbi:CiaD-like domain-containing protein [Helicobacter sp. 23-1045]